MVAQAMPDTGPGEANLVMSLGKFLSVIDSIYKRVMPGLAKTNLQQMQNYMRILGIILVPGAVHCLTGSGQLHCRN
jgi:hypothetical protein